MKPIFLTLALGAAGLGGTRAGESILPSELPPVVRGVLDQQFGRPKVEAASREENNRTVLYRVKFQRAGQPEVVTISEEGEVQKPAKAPQTK